MTNDLGIERLRASVASAAMRVPSVSAWSIGMHVDHCCLAMIGVGQSLMASAAPPPRSGFSLARSLVLLSGRIPRGRGRSPEVAQPSPDIVPEALHAKLDQSGRIVTEARDLDPETWFRHFVFGVLRRDQTLRFIGIHNRHHLRIIADILAV